MKKLMIAASVAICAAAGFAMESANIVGYASSRLQNGATMVVAQFVNVGANTEIPLQSIIAIGDDASDNVQIQTLDAAGRTVDAYDWNDWANDKPCWVDGEWNPIEGITIAPGQGLWIMGSAAIQGVQAAGQVGTSDVTVTLRSGGTATGNPFPVKIPLQDIIAEGDEASDNVQIQILDVAGRTLETYDWNDWANDSPCWVDGEWNPISGVDILPVHGLWVMGSNGNQSIRFPAPEL